MTSTPSRGNLHLTESCEGLMGNLDVKTVMAKSCQEVFISSGPSNSHQCSVFCSLIFAELQRE